MLKLSIRYRDGKLETMNESLYADWDAEWLIIRVNPTREEEFAGFRGAVRRLIPKDLIRYAWYEGD